MPLALLLAAACGAPVRAVGNEPGWSLELGPERSSLVLAYGERRLEFVTPVPRLEPGSTAVVYSAPADGDEVAIRIAAEPCADPMSGERFPARLEVSAGEERLEGCGRPLR